MNYLSPLDEIKVIHVINLRYLSFSEKNKNI